LEDLGRLLNHKRGSSCKSSFWSLQKSFYKVWKTAKIFFLGNLQEEKRRNQHKHGSFSGFQKTFISANFVDASQCFFSRVVANNRTCILQAEHTNVKRCNNNNEGKKNIIKIYCLFIYLFIYQPERGPTRLAEWNNWPNKYFHIQEGNKAIFNYHKHQ
jgi:hypothetical protein